MIWWFLILGISTLLVVCVAIALVMRLRRHLQAAQSAQEVAPGVAGLKGESGKVEP